MYHTLLGTILFAKLNYLSKSWLSSLYDKRHMGNDKKGGDNDNENNDNKSNILKIFLEIATRRLKTLGEILLLISDSVIIFS